jgi:dihydrofolate synthase/folylpolyglutamate synthase
MPPGKKDYEDVIQYLYGLQKHGIKLGLKNPVRLLDILGNPHNSFRSVHVAGTNGKGSTAGMIASILKSSGFRVGLFTSPHLVSFTERIRINDSPIPEPDVAKLTKHIRSTIADTRLNPTFFEFVTALAFCYFARKKIDWAVIEVGMGGRLDATNILAPDISVITNIGLDHSEFLGSTILDIAHEKAGIIKSSTPVITGTTHAGALQVLEETAKGLDTTTHALNRDFTSSPVLMDDRHAVFHYRDITIPCPRINSRMDLANLSIPLTGRHQIINASLAIRTCGVLRCRGVQIGTGAIRNGLLTLHSEGRMEIISRTPLIVIDSAHNPDAAGALKNTVKDVFRAKKIIVITGIMKDKDIKGILLPLTELTETFILTRPGGDRAASPEHLKQTIRSLENENRNNRKPSAIFTAEYHTGNGFFLYERRSKRLFIPFCRLFGTPEGIT